MSNTISVNNNRMKRTSIKGTCMSSESKRDKIEGTKYSPILTFFSIY